MIKRNITFIFSVLMLYVVFFNSCVPDEPCSEWTEFKSVIYDTFLLETDAYWKWDTNTVEIIDPDNKVVTFFKAGNYRTYMNTFGIEYIPFNYRYCINSGSNKVVIQSEGESWYSINSPLEIHLTRKVYVEEPDSFILDSLLSYYHGDSYYFSFSNPYGQFIIPEEAYVFLLPDQYIEELDSITLNGTTWKDVTHVYCKVSPIPAINPYVKGIYFKKGVGLICFYSSDNRYWYLKI